MILFLTNVEPLEMTYFELGREGEHLGAIGADHGRNGDVEDLRHSVQMFDAKGTSGAGNTDVHNQFS